MILSFEMEYPPTINHYYVRTKKGVAIKPEGRVYRQVAVYTLKKYKEQFTKDQRLAIVINAYPPDERKRDLDNILKCCLDSLQHAKIIPDDSQLDMITVIRSHKTKGGLLKIRLSEC